MKLSEFSHGQWYKIMLEEQHPDYQYYFRPYIAVFDSLDTPATRRRIRRRKMISGTLITVDEYKEFYTENYEQYLPAILSAEKIGVRPLVMNLLTIIVDEHNQYVEENGLTCTGQPPMLLRVKQNGWICLDAGSFFNTNLKRFAEIANAIDANYELLASEVLKNEGTGQQGVCFEIELHDGQ